MPVDNHGPPLGAVPGGPARRHQCSPLPAPCLAALGLKKTDDDTALAEYFQAMGYFDGLDQARNMVAQIEPVPYGQAGGFLIFPLKDARLEPDLIIVYGSPARMARLASGFAWSTGRILGSIGSGLGLSCLATVKPHWSGRPGLVVPGRGERILAGTEENEMLCTFPAKPLRIPAGRPSGDP